MQRILSSLRKAVEEYSMIEDGDKIAIGVSGGKDSLTLLLALKNLQIFYPKKFEILAITIDSGFDNFDIIYITFFIDKSYIKKIVFDER